MSLLVGSTATAAEPETGRSSSVEQTAPGVADEATTQSKQSDLPTDGVRHGIAIKLTPEVVKAGNPVNVVISGLDYNQEVDLEITGPQDFISQVHLGRFQPPMGTYDLRTTLPTFEDQPTGVYTVTFKRPGVSATFTIVKTRKGEPETPKPTPEPETPKPTPEPETPKPTPEPETPKPTPEPETPKPGGKSGPTAPAVPGDKGAQSPGKIADTAGYTAAKPAPKAPSLARTGVSVPVLSAAGLVLLLAAGGTLALRYRRRLIAQD
ncbi:hypothetical protein [Actinomyces bovis]|nr:hypothetical protein [Actinomyces bovis]